MMDAIVEKKEKTSGTGRGPILINTQTYADLKCYLRPGVQVLLVFALASLN